MDVINLNMYDIYRIPPVDGGYSGPFNDLQSEIRHLDL